LHEFNGGAHCPEYLVIGLACARPNRPKWRPSTRVFTSLGRAESEAVSVRKTSCGRCLVFVTGCRVGVNFVTARAEGV
jgi:hypothetical protein